MNELLVLCKNQDKEYESTVYTLQHQQMNTEPVKVSEKFNATLNKSFLTTGNKDFYQVHT